MAGRLKIRYRFKKSSSAVSGIFPTAKPNLPLARTRGLRGALGQVDRLNTPILQCKIMHWMPGSILALS